jgi:aspartate 1-decarboxylase
MQIQMLKSKLHEACVTDANIHYEGSLGIDVELMEAVGLYPHEKVLVSNINNGARFETYTIPAPYGSRLIVLNGAAARLGAVGDRIIIMSFAWVEEALVRDGKYRPRTIRLDRGNDPIPPLTKAPSFDEIASMIGG